jgi:hypothetical protein
MMKNNELQTKYVIKRKKVTKSCLFDIVYWDKHSMNFGNYFG